MMKISKHSQQGFHLVLILILLTTVSCQRQKLQPVSGYVKLVKTIQVEETAPEIIQSFPGVVEEAEAVNLAFRVAGPLNRIYIKEGQQVRKGQLLAEMDTRDYLVQKQAIEAQAEQIRNEYQRVEELKNRNSIAENDYEKMKAGKDMVEARLKNANDQLQDTRLLAPFDGYITKVYFEEGELVNHGMPIAKMVDLSALQVKIDVPAGVCLNRESIGHIECTQEQVEGKSFPMTLFSQNMKANNNGLYRLYLSIQNGTHSGLLPGMSVSVHLTMANSAAQTLCIPLEALQETEKGSFVWLVKDSMVQQQTVETNHRIASGCIGIISGLSRGETIVVGGLNLLTEGEKVREIPPSSATNVGNLL